MSMKCHMWSRRGSGSRRFVSAKNSSGGLGSKPPGSTASADSIQGSQVMKSFSRRKRIQIFKGVVEAPLVLLDGGGGELGRKRAVLQLLQGERGAGAAELALMEHHQLGMGVGDERDVRQVPVVIGDSHAGGSGLGGRLLLDPAAVVLRRGQRRLDRRGERGIGATLGTSALSAVVCCWMRPPAPRHRSFPFPVRFLLACASNGGTTRSPARSSRSASAESGNLKAQSSTAASAYSASRAGWSDCSSKTVT
jgi:hypothetical protein